MINREIYNSALAILSQSSTDMEDHVLDYEERAPYLLACFCNEVNEIDVNMRRALGASDGLGFNRVYVSLDDDFPLLERFVSVAAKYLAAMLILNDNEELSDKLFHLYCEGIELIRNEIPTILESIVNKYL